MLLQVQEYQRSLSLLCLRSQGISQATAVSFAREGCRKIVLADRDSNGLERTKDLISRVASDAQVLAQVTDVTKAEQLDQLIEAAVKQFGRVDYAINGAGKSRQRQTCILSLTRDEGVLSNNQKSGDTSPEEFDRINGINYRGCWLSSRAEIKQMLKQEPLATHDGRPGSRGAVVNIASQLGIVGRPAARESSNLHIRYHVYS